MDRRGEQSQTVRGNGETAAQLIWPNQLATDPSLDHFDVADFDGVDGKHVIAQQEHIGEFAGSDRAFFLLLEFGVSRARGVGLNRLLNTELLFGKPSTGIFAVKRGTRGCRV